MFCVECGEEISIFKEGLCINCYLKSHIFTKGPNELDLPVCQFCGSLKYKNNWYLEKIENILKKWIKQNYEISKELKNVEIKTSCKETKHGVECKGLISGFVNDKKIIEKHDLLIHLKDNVCDVCSKRFGGYHEAIIQVRTEKRKFTDKEISKIRNFVENLVSNLQEKGNRGLFITDISEEHGGLDFFISDKSTAYSIAKEIQKKYSGTIKKSSKNIGMKEGKQVYRMTYLVRLSPYKIKDFIKVNDQYFIIESISSNKIKLINLKTWEQIGEELKNLDNAKIINNQDIVKDMILVSQTDKEIQVMQPETFQIKNIVKPKKIDIDSEKIKIVIIEDKLFIFPLIHK